MASSRAEPFFRRGEGLAERLDSPRKNPSGSLVKERAFGMTLDCTGNPN